MATYKKDERAYVKCSTCKKVKAFYQWFENPVIAVCGAHNNERQVAETLRICKTYVEADQSQLPPLKHFDHYWNGSIEDEEDNS